MTKNLGAVIREGVLIRERVLIKIKSLRGNANLWEDTKLKKYWLSATGGVPPQNDFCPSKIFKTTIERIIETIACCLKTMAYCLLPPKFFSGRKPEYSITVNGKLAHR